MNTKLKQFINYSHAFASSFKTPEGKKVLLHQKAHRFASETAIKQDEHGIYRSRDDISIKPLEEIDKKRNLKKYHANEDILALVEIGRKRTYSKKYIYTKNVFYIVDVVRHLFRVALTTTPNSPYHF